MKRHMGEKEDGKEECNSSEYLDVNLSPERKALKKNYKTRACLLSSLPPFSNLSILAGSYCTWYNRYNRNIVTIKEKIKETF